MRAASARALERCWLRRSLMSSGVVSARLFRWHELSAIAAMADASANQETLLLRMYESDLAKWRVSTNDVAE